MNIHYNSKENKITITGTLREASWLFVGATLSWIDLQIAILETMFSDELTFTITDDTNGSEEKR